MGRRLPLLVQWELVGKHLDSDVAPLVRVKVGGQLPPEWRLEPGALLPEPGALLPEHGLLLLGAALKVPDPHLVAYGQHRRRCAVG